MDIMLCVIGIFLLCAGFECSASLGTIPGPRSLDDKIAIIGAGASGIHMALKLKLLGFRRVTIYEKEDYVGGKLLDVMHRGTVQNMGAIYTAGNYYEVFNLINKYLPGHLKGTAEPKAWNLLPNKQYLKLSCVESIALEAKKLDPTIDLTNRTASALVVASFIQRYAKVLVDLFGQFPYEVMPRPSPQVLAALNMSYLDFLKKNNLEPLKAVMMCTTTVQGYGYLDELPALYGLMWNNLKLMTAVTNPNPSDPQRGSVSGMLDTGYQALFSTIAKQENLNVKLHKNVIGVKRKIDSFLIKSIDTHTDELCTKRYDFLIATPSMALVMNFTNFNRKERSVFSSIQDSNFLTSTLLDHDYSPERSSPREYFFDTLDQKQFGVHSMRDTYATINNISGLEYTSAPFPGGDDGLNISSTVVSQISSFYPTEGDINKNIEDHYRTKMAITIDPKKIILTKVWKYFPKLSLEAITEGVLWDILEMQGKYNMWYIGSSVCFESVNSVLNYNLQLLSMYKLPCN